MWNDITARHLLALQAVTEEGTFGRAADRLGFTQSAVSQQIASLEQIVGQPLFDRKPGPNPPTLTPAGEVVFGHAESLLEGIKTAEHELDRLARGVSGSLRVGTFQSISARVLPLALRQVYDHSPDVEISLVDDDLDCDVNDLVLAGEVDLAFAIGEAPEGIGAHYLAADPYVAIVPADEPPGAIKLTSLQSRPLIGQRGQPVAHSCGYAVNRELETLGVSPNYAFRSHDNGAVQGMVAAGVGIAIVPLLTVDTSDPRISVRSTEPEIEPRRISIVWDENRTLPPVAHQLIDILTAVCSEQLASTLHV